MSAGASTLVANDWAGEQARKCLCVCVFAFTFDWSAIFEIECEEWEKTHNHYTYRNSSKVQRTKLNT